MDRNEFETAPRDLEQTPKTVVVSIVHGPDPLLVSGSVLHNPRVVLLLPPSTDIIALNEDLASFGLRLLAFARSVGCLALAFRICGGGGGFGFLLGFRKASKGLAFRVDHDHLPVVIDRLAIRTEHRLELLVLDFGRFRLGVQHALGLLSVHFDGLVEILDLDGRHDHFVWVLRVWNPLLRVERSDVESPVGGVRGDDMELGSRFIVGVVGIDGWGCLFVGWYGRCLWFLGWWRRTSFGFSIVLEGVHLAVLDLLELDCLALLVRVSQSGDGTCA